MALVLAGLGIVALLGAGIYAYVFLTTSVGLGLGGQSGSSSFLPIDCGARIEWVIGGGPSMPQGNLYGLSGPEARDECHAQYDSKVAGWRAEAGVLVAIAVGGLVLAGAGAASDKRRKAV